MSHEPSRQPMLHPLAAAALGCFTHPRCRVLGRVVKHPATGAVMAANGCVAVRVTRGPVMHDEEVLPACEAFVKRVDGLPWGRFEPDGKRMTPPVWAGFDAIRGDLYSHGLEELWTERGAMTKGKPVWTGEAIMVPLALLQLIARLPRCEVRMDGNADFLLIRFAGGEGIVANRWKNVRGADMPAHVFSLFNRRSRPLPGGFSNH